MRNLYKINEVMEKFNVTSRMLRYYEDMGLVESVRLPDSPVRFYTPEQMERIGEVLLLRSIGMPIKNISDKKKGRKMTWESLLSLR